MPGKNVNFRRKLTRILLPGVIPDLNLLAAKAAPSYFGCYSSPEIS